MGDSGSPRFFGLASILTIALRGVGIRLRVFNASARRLLVGSIGMDFGTGASKVLSAVFTYISQPAS